jgi:hypothetical protein
MCEFKFDHQRDPQEIYTKAKHAITSNGGTIDGTEQSGTFAIEKFGMAVEGRYEIGTTAVKLYVDKKPFFVSCSQIESFIGSSFAAS